MLKRGYTQTGVELSPFQISASKVAGLQMHATNPVSDKCPLKTLKRHTYLKDCSDETLSIL